MQQNEETKVMDSTATTLDTPAAPLVATRRYGPVIYLGGTFLFSWLLLAVSVAAANAHASPPVPDALLITLATLGPIIGGIAAAAYEGGLSGVRALLKQILRWRVAPAWYARALLGPGLATSAGFV